MVLVALSLAQAGLLKPTWSASSSSPADDSGSYDAANLGDGKVSTAWFEGVDGSGLNEWVQADLGGEKTVTSFMVFGGWGFSRSYWGHYNRPKTVQVEFSDGSTQDYSLQDSFGPQVVTLSGPKKTTTMRFRLKGSYSSDAYPDTAISEIHIYDQGKDAWATPRGATASSTFPADADGSYDARNAIDGLADTVWCEGNKNGDGTGDWLEVSLAGGQTVGRLALRNGNGSSFSLFMKGNRSTQVTLAFSDGSRETVSVKDTMTEQTISFTPRTVDKVRITFDSVKKGSEFNDLCVAEARFLP